MFAQLQHIHVHKLDLMVERRFRITEAFKSDLICNSKCWSDGAVLLVPLQAFCDSESDSGVSVVSGVLP